MSKSRAVRKKAERVTVSDKIIRLAEGDRLEMKKPHPCGSCIFTVLRAGSDVRVLCAGCGRNMLVDRLKLERGIRRKLDENEQT